MNFLKKAGKQILNTIRGGFSVSPRILDHLGIQAYTSIKKSLVELASNSYDADATEVRISLPNQIEQNSQIILEDNGIGMSTKEFQEHYLQIGRDRRQRGADTSPSGRKIIGNKGIGKLAGFGIAGLIRVETYKDNIMTAANLKREDFNKNKDLEATKFDIETYQLKNASSKGTKIILKELKQDLSVPEKTFLRRYLRNNLPKYENFKIFVDDTECTVEDIHGEKHNIDETIESLNKPIKGYYIIAKANQANPGLAVRVRGRLVTKPSFFDSQLDSFTRYISRRFTGELDADFLDEGNGKFQSLINTSRTGFVEENKTVEKFNLWAKDFLKRILKEESKKQLTGQTTKILKSETIDVRLKGLPSPVRSKAKEIISTLVAKMKEQEDEDIIDFAGLILQYFESNVLKELLDSILKADSNDVEKLADLISEWGIRDIAGVVNLIKQHIQIIKKLKELVNNKNTPEKHIHTLFEKNLWLLDDKYKLWESNRTLKTILGENLDKKFEKKKNLRPDLVCLTSQNEAIVIEFKKPSVTISTRDLAQTMEYQGLIQEQMPNIQNITTFIIGKKYDESIKTIKSKQEMAGNFLMSYSEVLSNAERKFSDILKILENK